MRYQDAGVDLARSDALKAEVIREIRSTWGDEVVPLAGGFAGVMRFPGAPGLLAATMDGVGTKLHLAKLAHRLDDAAADLVFHGANDLLAHGARPLAFLDYLAQAALAPEDVLAAVRGLARACREVGAALIGGETAEMPDTYLPGVLDVAGCMLGTVVPGALLDGARVAAGDHVLGLAGSGLHTNGYSLARRVLAGSGLALDAPLPGGQGESLGEALLAPHRWYGRSLLPLAEAGRVNALAHVTGGGIAGNLVRVLPEGCRARLEPGAWRRPALFRWLVAAGQVPEADARRAWNLGIGMLVVVASAQAPGLSAELAAAGETVWPLGSIVAGPRGVEWSPGEPG
ncbi:MAG TPA: phosphoribosylformylglycinamidine cyclo-ligase [Candidatus Eisenbacteria bacterium]|jgi:phosphoribosylformylglycinamidine cyclo-ligase